MVSALVLDFACDYILLFFFLENDRMLCCVTSLLEKCEIDTSFHLDNGPSGCQF